MKSPKLLTCVRCAVGVLSEVNYTFIVFYKLNFYEKWYCYYFSFFILEQKEVWLRAKRNKK
nr:MAG TPA: hypothetical protein [Caudoviricetes sp.]